MAAGFRDLLAWLLSWKSNHGFQAIGGPYNIVAGQASSPLAVGLVRHSGAAVGETLSPGDAAGGIFQPGVIAGMTFATNIYEGQCHG